MSAITQTRLRMNPGWVKRNVVVRRAKSGSVHSIECSTCGGYTHSIADLAQVIGVSTGALSKFLRRETVRADIAALIRSSVLRVEE